MECELAALLEEKTWLLRRTEEVAARIALLEGVPSMTNRPIGSAIYMQSSAATVMLGDLEARPFDVLKLEQQHIA